MRCETEIGAWTLDEATLVLGRTWERMISEGQDPFEIQNSEFRIQNFRSVKNDPRRKVKKADLAKLGIQVNK